jgi:hypothetical protein
LNPSSLPPLPRQCPPPNASPPHLPPLPRQCPPLMPARLPKALRSPTPPRRVAERHHCVRSVAPLSPWRLAPPSQSGHGPPSNPPIATPSTVTDHPPLLPGTSLPVLFADASLDAWVLARGRFAALFYDGNPLQTPARSTRIRPGHVPSLRVRPTWPPARPTPSRGHPACPTPSLPMIPFSDCRSSRCERLRCRSSRAASLLK